MAYTPFGWPGQFAQPVRAAPYLDYPTVYIQARYDGGNWGTRTQVLSGSSAPLLGKMVPLSGKDESGGTSDSGYTIQIRVISCGAGRPQRPVVLQLYNQDLGYRDPRV